jgi:hypothetical protein
MSMQSLRRVGRLFRITNGFEAGCVIYALALGAAMRGQLYLQDYPGGFGWALYAACLLAVLLAGAAMVDGVRAIPPQPRTQSRLQRLARRARGR